MTDLEKHVNQPGRAKLVKDVRAKIKELGGNVLRDAGPMMHGKTVIAFIEDPSGYKVELIQKGTF